MAEPIKIVMLGGRRCGKSSVLASMLKCYEEKTLGTGFDITPMPGTDRLLEDKLNDLKTELFSKKTDCFTVDENPTNEINSFSFQLTAKNISEKLVLKFIDIPGEVLTAPTSQYDSDDIKEIISDSNVIIIAVDSVHLIEENGRFARVYNKTDLITNWIVSSDFLASDLDKLVLFVPLKCETYFRSGRMAELNHRIKTEYEKLFYVLSSNNVKEKFTVAITPILTVGNVVFDKFGRNENGEIILKKDRGSEYIRPIYTYYKYTKPAATLEPKFCEQPLLYIAKFTLNLYNKHNKANSNKASEAKSSKKKMPKSAKIAILIGGAIGGIWGMLLALHLAKLKVFSSPKFQKAVVSSTIHLKREGNGYEIVQNPIAI